MKQWLTYALCMAVAAATAQTKTRVHVTYTNNYCGGARPTPKIEQKVKTPLDFTNATLVLIGKSQVKVKTDSAAYFSAALKPGKYKVRMSKAKQGMHALNYDPSCAKMVKMTYGELLVSKGVYEYELNLHFPCNPCQPPRE